MNDEGATDYNAIIDQMTEGTVIIKSYSLIEQSLILYTYKFSRDVIFADCPNLGFP